MEQYSGQKVMGDENAENNNCCEAVSWKRRSISCNTPVCQKAAAPGKRLMHTRDCKCCVPQLLPVWVHFWEVCESSTLHRHTGTAMHYHRKIIHFWRLRQNENT